MDCYAWVLMPNHFHFLLRTGSIPLPTFMRRFLTAYSVYYNRRYERSGHLFQNRYRSIICEEDPYFTELVRYIHLNPVRGGIVKDLLDLERYPWSGHRILMGEKSLLAEFGRGLELFRQSLGQGSFEIPKVLHDALQQGRRPDFSGERLTLFGIKNRGITKRKPRSNARSKNSGKVEFAQKILSHHPKIQRQSSCEPPGNIS